MVTEKLAETGARTRYSSHVTSTEAVPNTPQQACYKYRDCPQHLQQTCYRKGSSSMSQNLESYMP